MKKNSDGDHSKCNVTFQFNPFMHNVKWPNILYKSYGVNAARFLKYVWPFDNIMYERVNNNYRLRCEKRMNEFFSLECI